MLSQESIEHFRFEGARVLLAGTRGRKVTLCGPTPEYEVLDPEIRALWERERRGGRSLYEVAAELRYAADLLESGGSGLPVDFSRPDWLSDAAEAPQVYRGIAAYLESWPAGAFARVQGQAPTRRELMHRFPSLGQLLLNYFGQDGAATEDDLDEAQGLQLFIDDAHPHCLWVLPAIVAECAEAQAIFHDEDALRSFFEDEHAMGSGELAWSDWIPLIARTLTDHMRAQHPPRWSSE